MVSFRSMPTPRRGEGPWTILGGRVSEVHVSHFVLGTGGARFFFWDGVPRPTLRVNDNVTVKAVRVGSRYFVETVTLNPTREDGLPG